MGVDSKHPDYSDHIGEWTLMRDASRGEKAIKEAGEKYLPMPSGFRSQTDGGKAYYDIYQTRAQFPSILPLTIGGMVGVIHRVEAKIDMPDAMQPLWEKATADELPLEAFHRRITAELLTTGRYSILADAASEGSDLPWLAGYGAEALINWSDERDLFVLDETGPERNGFDWRTQQKYRVLDLIDGRYRVRTFTGTTEDIGADARPTARGAKPLTEIPFVVIGATDLSLDPEDPPLLGVARSSVALYQLSADYRWQLYMTGQETLVVINGDAPDTVGAGVVMTLKGAPQLTPDAKYVGPSGTGIAAHRQAIIDERDNAVAAGARLFDNTQKSAESGEALRLRYTAQTATLTTISQASAAGLERALRYIAIMIGANPDEVVVTPNLQFIDQKMTPQDAVNLVKVWQAGGISQLTLFENFQRGEIVTAERSFEEEKEEIAKDQEGMEPEQQLDPVTGQPIDPEAQQQAA